MKQAITILVVAIALLAGCKSATQTTATEPQKDSTSVASGAIVYVNVDSLIANYAMYKDMSTDFQDKQKKAEASVTSRGKSLEKELMSYQEKIQKGLVTRAQAQALEEDLTKKQQDFMQLRDTKVAELAEEEQVMLNNIHHSIVVFLKEFNSDKRYSMIISTTSSGPVLDADPSLDITTTVIAGINKKYASEKGKK